MATAKSKKVMNIITTGIKPNRTDYGLCMIPFNTGKGIQPSLDQVLIGYLKQLTSVEYIRNSGGSMAAGTHWNATADGYGGVEDDYKVRGLDWTKVLHGRLSQHYGYQVFKDNIALCKILGVAYYPVLSPTSPVIDSKEIPYVSKPLNFTRAHNEIDYIFNEAKNQGVKIGAWQIGEESAVKELSDVFPTLDVFIAIATDYTNYILSKDSTATIIYDGSISGDNTCRFNHGGVTLNGALRNIKIISGKRGKRDYLQNKIFVGTPTFEIMMANIDNLAGMLDIFQGEFPAPWEWFLTQQQVGWINDDATANVNPLQDTVGQMLIISKLLMRCIIESAKRNLPIHFIHSQVSGLISNGFAKPLFYAIKLLQSSLINDGVCEYEFINMPEAAGLIVLPVKRGIEYETTILNPTTADVLIPLTWVDGKKEMVAITEGLYGEISAATATSYTSFSSSSVLSKAHSIIKIQTQ